MQKNLNCCCPTGSANTKRYTESVTERFVLEVALKITLPWADVSAATIENKQCCDAVGVSSRGEVQGRGGVPTSVGSLPAASSATSFCPILGSHCLPILEGCSSKVGGIVYSVDTKGQDPGWEWGCPWNSLGHPSPT